MRQYCLTRHISVLNGFRSGLEGSSPFGSGSRALQYFKFDDSATLFRVEIPCDREGGSRRVLFVSLFVMMVWEGESDIRRDTEARRRPPVFKMKGRGTGWRRMLCQR